MTASSLYNGYAAVARPALYSRYDFILSSSKRTLRCVWYMLPSPHEGQMSFVSLTPRIFFLLYTGKTSIHLAQIFKSLAFIYTAFIHTSKFFGGGYATFLLSLPQSFSYVTLRASAIALRVAMLFLCPFKTRDVHVLVRPIALASSVIFIFTRFFLFRNINDVFTMSRLYTQCR